MRRHAMTTTSSSTAPLRPTPVRYPRLGLLAFAALALSILVGVGSAYAQGRPIPEKAKVGTLVLGVFPRADLDGKPITLGAGARIHDRRNLIVTPASIKDARHLVAYVTGPQDEILSAWILTDAEIAALRERQRRARR
jgi:hypothetical protein